MTELVKPDAKFLASLVGNREAYAVQKPDGSYEPHREPWTAALLRKHLSGELTLGTYVVWGDKAKTLVLDIDDGDLDKAQALGRALVALGVPKPCIGIEESGRKGYHVWVVLDDYVEAQALRRLGRAALMEAGLPLNIEVFPKQDEVREGGLGNLVKLPGGTHRVTGKPNLFMGRLPRPMDVEILLLVTEGLPVVQAAYGSGRPESFGCIARIQEGATEGGRNNALYHLATMLRRGGVSDENVEDIVWKANAKSDPPLDSHEVRALLESSKHSGPICGQLSPELRDGCACIMERHPGLFTRPGALRHAAEGEHVVIRVMRRDGDLLDLDHEDIDRARAALRRRG